MSTFLVCTNFSEASKNALDYACDLTRNYPDSNADILLVHINFLPVSYSADGMAVVSLNKCIDDAYDEMQAELARIRAKTAGLSIKGRVITGNFMEELHKQVDQNSVSMVVMGSEGHCGELWSWDNDVLRALRNLPVPVLTIPQSVSWVPYQNIALACDLKAIGEDVPLSMLNSLVNYSKAKLHIIYVAGHDIKPGSDEYLSELRLHHQLKGLQPAYHIIYDDKITPAINKFIHTNHIELLLIMPRKHNLWDDLFHKNYAKELSNLNCTALMALH